MRFDRDLLIFKALCALSEYADASRDAPLKPTWGLRFALAFLYSQTDGDSRTYTAFWEQVQGKHDHGLTQQDYVRSTASRTELYGIINTLHRWKCPGVPHQLISDARSSGDADKVFRAAREAEAKRLADYAANEREIARMKRESKDCGYL